jgi:uncharacterized protein
MNAGLAMENSAVVQPTLTREESGFAVARSERLAITLLFGFGVLMGFATAPTLSYYASTNPQVLWQAGGATALFIAGFGAVGYATRRDLSSLARVGRND